MRYIESNVEEYIEDLRSICGVPSVSAQNTGIDECVRTLADIMEDAGINVQVIPVRNGNPVIYGELRGGGTERCIGFYNHYDVQPPEPLDLWESPPFKPEVREGRIFARGVSDNKGNIISRIEAVKAVTKILGKPPINLKFIVEGEEEIGSPNLDSFIADNLDRIRADACLWEAGDLTEQGVPNFYLGVKGMLYVEIRKKTADSDKHSMYAPIIPNAAWEIIQILANMRDKQGRVKISGFYKRVKPPTREELRNIREIKIDYKQFIQQLGVGETKHKTAYQALRDLVFNPTCNIAGLASGHVGKGAKTITPAQASVKIDFRLVPDQRPEEILESLRKFVKRFGDFEIEVYTMLPPARSRPSSPVVKAAVESALEVYGVKPNVFPSMYGTGPLASIVKHGIDAGMLNSLSNPESNLHAPNENILKRDFMLSTIHLASMLRRLAT